MKILSAEEYLQIIEKKTPGTLVTLHHHKFIAEADSQIYYLKKNRNNIIFKTEHYSKFYVVRFFLHDDDELFTRYHQAEAYLNSKSLAWKVPFRFMDEEYYPVLMMDWIESFSFSEYLDRIIDEPSRISKLQHQLISLSRDLEKNGIGHGNLNLTHIRFTKQDHDLKLIDYDSLFIPAFKGKDSFSAGTSGFQHPIRLSSDFSETIDRFSFWVFITALEAFKNDPSLWKKANENGFNKEEQILFNYRDIAFPHQSAMFEKLRRYHNPALNFYCDKLIAFSNSTSLEQIEMPMLYEEKNISFINTGKHNIYQPQKISNTTIKQNVTGFENDTIKNLTPVQETIKPINESISAPENKRRNTGTIDFKKKVDDEEEQELINPVKRKKKKPVPVFIIIGVLLLFATASYFVWNNETKKQSTLVASVPEQQLNQRKEDQKAKETIFTSTNITQFLFRLYQSYNERNLSSILSNYADSVSQYYDAGSMSKNKLSGVIKNLFIKPVHYECHPDLSTLQFNVSGDNCKLNISINETIKADRRSKRENYSSKIEYTVDSSFKILAEKNIE